MKKLLAVLLTVALLLGVTGCQQNTKSDDADFTTLTKGWFADDLSGDYLSLRYTVAKPENYGITELPEATLGSLGGIDDTASRDQLNERIKALQDYDTSKLSDHQLITYNTLLDYYQLQVKYYGFSEDYSFMFTPMSGLNNNLITNLTELELRDEQDVKDFISLVKDSPRLIDEAIAYTKKQANQGIVQPNAVQTEVIDNCQTFISKKDDNAVIVAFSEKLDALNLSNSNDYLEELTNAVIDELIPAYQRIIDMYNNSLSGLAKTNGALCNYKNGKEYYKVLLQDYTGTSADPADVAKLLWDYVDKLVEEEITLANNYPAVYYAYYGIDYEATLNSYNTATGEYTYVYLENPNSQFGMSDAATIIAAYREALKKDYPTGPDVKVTADLLDESIATDGVVAYYVTAPVDDYINDNVIKINPAYSSDDADSLCSTLAHEGFPGHCYQITYYLDHYKDDVIRSNISYLGYTEGWAMLSEDTAYNYLTNDTNQARLYQLEDEIGYIMQAALDIEVNYNGADAAKVAQLLVDHVYTNYTADEMLSSAQSLITTLVGDPGTYTSYGYGYYAMLTLKDTAKEKLGSKFDLKTFHQAILDTGATSFDILNEQVAKALGYSLD